MMTNIREHFRNGAALLVVCGVVVGVGSDYAEADQSADKKITAMDQAQGTKMDVETTRQIRRKLIDDKTLSTAAKNLNIVTLGDNITIAGTVKSERELVAVRQHISNIAASANIDDRQVKLSKSK